MDYSREDDLPFDALPAAPPRPAPLVHLQTVRVVLDERERELAAQVGTLRHINATNRRKPSRDGDLVHWGDHVEGAGAECAVAKQLGRYWPPNVNDDPKAAHVGDVAGGYEVRWRSRQGNLWLHATRDRLDAFWILVHGALPEYELVGWLHGVDAVRPDWWRSLKQGNPPCYVVPHDKLHDLTTLPGWPKP